MKLPHGLAASRSFEIPERAGSYQDVASEYYDATLHPTCADFRDASRLYLRRLFSQGEPRGRIADIGCGRSLLNEFVETGLVLIDSSQRMLDQNVARYESHLIDIERESFGSDEFDWVFAILADPYNSLASWRHIHSAMKVGGRCVFIVPSFRWASAFRKTHYEEKEGYALFVTHDKRSVFLPSTVLSESAQRQLIEAANLRLVDTAHIYLRDMIVAKSPKISASLSSDDEVLDVYLAAKV